MADTSKGLMISAPKKSSGKTTVTLGLTAALNRRSKNIRVFKKGPDYIDPMWHKAASGHTCYNIDPFWMDDELCRQSFFPRCAGMDLCLVEGNHGLHDGLDLHGQNSGGFLAKLLDIPVLLVVDSAGMNRGVAAIVLGQQLLDSDVCLSGVILNNVATPRQAGKQTAAVEHYCGIPVIGAIPRSKDLGIKERHLGLVTVHENPHVQKTIDQLAKTVAENCDLDMLLTVAGDIVIQNKSVSPEHSTTGDKVTIGVAYDKSFCFYYPENLDALSREGAELVFFDTLNDTALPKVDGIYIGGGFPESFLQELEQNITIRKELAAAIERGMPVFAECGGLMYLTRSIERAGVKKEMVGVIAADVLFYEKPVGKGYVELDNSNQESWFPGDGIIKGHEFHYSRLINMRKDLEFKFKIVRGTGVDGVHDGILYKNVLASYTHIHASVVPGWAKSFIEQIRENR